MTRTQRTVLKALSFTLFVSVAALAAGCGCVEENPRVQPLSSACPMNQRLVLDVCTELGSRDECTDVGDVCVALCDGRASCSTESLRLRAVSGFPTAPNGYCVVCDDPLQ